MRYLSIVLMLLLAVSSDVFSQDYTLKVRKPERESDYFPHVAGVMDGEIDALKLCTHIITNNKKWTVVSFSFSIGANSGQNYTEIKGDRFPAVYCDRWKRPEFKGVVIFLSDIMAMDLNGNLQKLNNLKLIVN